MCNLRIWHVNCFYLIEKAARTMRNETDLVEIADLDDLKNEYFELVFSTMADGREEMARLMHVSPSSISCWVYTGGRIGSSH